MLKLMNPKTNSPSNVDLAPLPERRRSTFREPAAEVDLGLFGLRKGDPGVGEVTDIAVAPPVAEVSDVAPAPKTPDADAGPVRSVVADEPESIEIPASIEVPEPIEVPDPIEIPASIEVPEPIEVPASIEATDWTETGAPDVPVVAPSQRRARHRADRAGNRRATGSSSMRALPAH